jgi:hypothetical protein
VDAPDQPGPEEPDAAKPSEPPPETATGPDIATIALLVFFIALIGIVIALLLLPILAGGSVG